ncbi:inhibitor of KinA [Orenia metallireducens]|jgi:KipI family sensor histidine kinase inhibitor|uniref:Inhibitor of KinA n=1 Tax=Orenia metallireducens TaxID=1413210 RepID=A0A285I573_9FIRM|nr:5-oxoprolinase subunit PxpB [Orenia metallireducens]PRX19718.1 inhibitor of KinA [Orenia metallireducens]SNY43120.1 inhibitor of KinA [Orenia metallireducens]
MREQLEYFPASDNSILVKFGDEIKKEINQEIQVMLHLLEKEAIAGVIEYIPSYTKLMIVYDPLTMDYDDLVAKLKELEDRMDTFSTPSTKIIEIPVMYGGEYGPDLEAVAKYNNLSTEEVIKIHSSRDYLIYMLGFTPGFPYLGGMSKKIATPRLKKPRKKVPAGSIGIAEQQTGIYPISSPGGWQIIARTPIKLFDPHRKVPFLLEAGAYLRFIPIRPEKFEWIEKKGGFKWGV